MKFSELKLVGFTWFKIARIWIRVKISAPEKIRILNYFAEGYLQLQLTKYKVQSVAV